MGVVLAFGLLLCVLGLIMLLNLFGAADLVIRRVTSRFLGELAPGFAASRRGFRTYAALLIAVGVLCVGLAMTARFIAFGAALLAAGALLFGIGSVVAIAGEIETYRALKR
ncbi:MAG: hypothetical protein M3R21_06195 [Candidatus Dormibacteraeota bacterium]|nr:hypothetical protein [Candidatus Dormibacteraeota bacterium]